MRNCFENIQQIYQRTPKQKCDFNKVALYLHGNHTSAEVFSSKFAAYFRTTFYKNAFEGLLLFVCLNFDFFAFVLLHSFYVSCELLYFSINWSVKAATGISSTKKLYWIFAQKLLEEVQVLVAFYVVSLKNILNWTSS